MDFQKGMIIKIFLEYFLLSVISAIHDWFNILTSAGDLMTSAIHSPLELLNEIYYASIVNKTNWH